MLRDLNRRFAAKAPTAVTILDLEYMQARCGGKW